MSLNLNQKAATPSGRYYISVTYTEAVNDAQFVRLFGMAVLGASVVGIIFGPVHIGIALAILSFGSTKYYRGLGIAICERCLVGNIAGTSKSIRGKVT